MAIKYGGKNITNLRVRGKTVSSIYFGGEKVFSNSLPAGTILFYPSHLIEVPVGKKTEVSLEGVKPNLSNISTSIKISGKRIGKAFSKTVSKQDLIGGVTLYYSLKAVLISDTNKLSFTYGDSSNGIGVAKIELV